MNHAKAHDFDVFESGQHPQNPRLLAPFQSRLKTDQIIHRAIGVFGAQLHGGKRPTVGFRIGQTGAAQAARNRIVKRPRLASSSIGIQLSK